MSRFTVTIESDHADGGTMTIHLDTSSGTPRVLEVTMAAAAGGSVSAASFTQLALDRLVSAFTADTPAPPAAPAPAQSAPSQPSTTESATAQPTASEAATSMPPEARPAAATPVTGEAAMVPTIPTQIPATAAPDKATTPAKATARPRAKAAKAGTTAARAGTAPAKAVAKTPAKAAGATARRATKTATTARRAAKTATTARRATKARAGAAADGDGRQYRRMPDPSELVGAYNEAASVNELAARYEVPRHTMNGWLARLRREGLIVARRGAAARS